MLRRWQTSAFIVLAAASLSAVACGDDDDDNNGSGGRGGKSNGGSAGASKGGASNQGGTLGKGGNSTVTGGTGGKVTFGGATGAGGRGQPGGAAGQAGAPEGGAVAIAGAGGAGGASAGAGGAAEAGSGGEGGSAALDLCRGIELPTDGYYVAPGLCVRAVASKQGEVRQLSFDTQGNLLAVTVAGAVMRYRDVNGDGRFSGAAEIVKIADTGGNGNNVHLDASTGYLYAGTAAGVRRWLYSSTSNDLGAGENVVTGEPSTGNHTFHTVHVYGGWLYVHSGSAENAIAPASPDYDTNRAVLKRFRLADFTPGTPFAWSAGTVFSSGLRNMVGFTQRAGGALYGVVNGIDDLRYQGQDVHLDNPGEDLELLEANQGYGYPYCFTASHIVTNATVVPPGTQLAGTTADFANPHDDTWCASNAVPPVTFLPPHSAPLDLAFFDAALPAGGLPEGFRGGAFVALHGSWNTTPSVGHQIVFVPFDANGTAPKPTATLAGTTFPFTVVFSGGTSSAPTPGIWGWQSGSEGESPVRFAGVAISPTDGALYVSSDNASVLNGATGENQGYIYRIAWKH